MCVFLLYLLRTYPEKISSVAQREVRELVEFMNGIIGTIPGVAVYIDDIIITGNNDTEHIQNLHSVMNKLQSAGVRIEREKCKIMENSVEYLGHRIGEGRISPTDEKIRDLVEAPEPKNVKDLKSFLGMINFQERYIPNMHPICDPLYRLTRKGVRFEWKKQEQQAFEAVRRDDFSFAILCVLTWNRKRCYGKD